jgi:hypothetical protein
MLNGPHTCKLERSRYLLAKTLDELSNADKIVERLGKPWLDFFVPFTGIISALRIKKC